MRRFRARFLMHWIGNACRHLRGCFKETVESMGVEIGREAGAGIAVWESYYRQ